jgi:hypothetical protein
VKLTLIVRNALNGDADTVDPAVRRTLYAIANEHDEQALEWDNRVAQLTAHIDEQTAKLEKDVAAVRRLLMTLTGTVVTGIIVGVVNILITL